jgi:hypothetical protein
MEESTMKKTLIPLPVKKFLYQAKNENKKPDDDAYPPGADVAEGDDALDHPLLVRRAV